MERSRKNKENIPQNGSLSNTFRVKKCLFDKDMSGKDKALSSKAGQQRFLADSPMVISPYVEDNPYSRFEVKKKKSVQTKLQFDLGKLHVGLNSPKPSQQKFFGDSPVVLPSCNEDSPYSQFEAKRKKSDVQSLELDKELNSPRPGQQQILAGSPMFMSPLMEDSPYSLFKVKKKTTAKAKLPPCIDYSASGSIVSTPTNKKHTSKIEKTEETLSAHQENSNAVKLAVQKSMLDPNLTGDFSKQCILPIIQGRHPDLKTISPDVVASLLQRPMSFNFTLIDCRYPYEFEGGHIKNAQNIYMKEDIVKQLLEYSTTVQRVESKEVLIFYCEFSSERGPSMLRHLRNTDRDMNRDFYPFLYYPELYVMEGGYKAFFSSFQELCDPPEYKRMLDKDCADQLAFYKSKCKSSSRTTKRLKRTRSSLVF